MINVSKSNSSALWNAVFHCCYGILYPTMHCTTQALCSVCFQFMLTYVDHNLSSIKYTEDTNCAKCTCMWHASLVVVVWLCTLPKHLFYNSWVHLTPVFIWWLLYVCKQENHRCMKRREHLMVNINTSTDSQFYAEWLCCVEKTIRFILC